MDLKVVSTFVKPVFMANYLAATGGTKEAAGSARYGRGEELARQGEVRVIDSTHFVVHDYEVSRSEEGVWSCTCPDAAKRHVPCKHIAAAMLVFAAHSLREKAVQQKVAAAGLQEQYNSAKQVVASLRRQGQKAVVRVVGNTSEETAVYVEILGGAA